MNATLDRRDLARQLSLVIGRFNRRGWCLGTSGNFSALLQECPRQLLITGSGLNKSELGDADFVCVGADGALLAGEAGRPSAETLLHLAVSEHTGARSVLHTHSVAATLVGEHYGQRGNVTIGGYEMLKGLRGVRTHEGSLSLPVIANSQDMTALSRTVVALLANGSTPPGFLIAGHGLYAWGETLEEAERHVEILEFLLECVARRTRFSPLPS